MGYKATRTTKHVVPDKVVVRWVGKAHCWCRTEFKDGKQIVGFYHTKLDAMLNQEKINV